MKQTINRARNLFRECLTPLYGVHETEAVFSIVGEHLTGYNRSGLLVNGNDELSTDQWHELIAILARLEKNEPIQYILGIADFYELQFNVNKNTLIPRQETELLVDLIIKEHKEKPIHILDIGTGSGCIAISLKKNMKSATVDAVDISEEALKVAVGNAVINSVDVSFTKCNILEEGLSKKFDLIVSNPPYVKEEEKSFMKSNVLDFEPHLALFVPDNDALKFYRAIASYARKHLNKGGQVWLEINEALGEETKEVFREAGFENTAVIKDLNGKSRIVKAW